jgi:hemerythrin
MNLDLVSEVWDILRDHIDVNDRKDAAATLVTLLIEHNYEVENIKDSFRDKDITSALKDYADEHFVEEEEEEYDEYDDDDKDTW